MACKRKSVKDIKSPKTVQTKGKLGKLKKLVRGRKWAGTAQVLMEQNQ